MPPLLKGVFYLLALSLLAHPVGQALPRRWFSGDRRGRLYRWMI